MPERNAVSCTRDPEIELVTGVIGARAVEGRRISAEELCVPVWRNDQNALKAQSLGLAEMVRDRTHLLRDGESSVLKKA